MWIYLKQGFRPIHNSIGILETYLDGTKFSKYVVVSKAYPQNEKRHSNIDHHISYNF
jgi:hypothetical protein